MTTRSDRLMLFASLLLGSFLQYSCATTSNTKPTTAQAVTTDKKISDKPKFMTEAKKSPVNSKGALAPGAPHPGLPTTSPTRQTTKTAAQKPTQSPQKAPATSVTATATGEDQKSPKEEIKETVADKKNSIAEAAISGEASGICRTGKDAQLKFSRTYLNELLGTNDEEKFRLGKKYSFSFTDTSLRDALNELSIESKIPIILDESVSGMISLTVKHQSFLDSLEMLISTGPYDYKFTGSYFYIGMLDPKAESWRKLSETYQYKLKHASSSTVMKLINPLYKNAVLADDTLGIISIVAPKNILTEILRIVDGVDHRSRQILLRMSISEVDGKAQTQLGRYLGNMGNGFGIANSLSPIAPAFHSAVLNKSTFTEFLSSLTAMNAQGKADIKAQPKIIVQDGQKASFKSLQKTLIQGTSVLASSRLNFVETGIDMAITPNIVEDDAVSLNIDDAKSGDFDFDDSNIVNEHTISTKVRVRPGESLLLGGMLSKKKVKIVNKIPLLGDIPLIGWLFRSEDHQIKTVEVIFTISPEILCDN